MTGKFVIVRPNLILNGNDPSIMLQYHVLMEPACMVFGIVRFKDPRALIGRRRH